MMARVLERPLWRMHVRERVCHALLPPQGHGHIRRSDAVGRGLEELHEPCTLW